MAFGLNILGPLPKTYAQVLPELGLPNPGMMIGPSPAFVPVILRGIKVHPDNPFQFDFIVDTGNAKFQNDALKQESTKLIKYFLASLTVPEDDLWVNLSPYEKDRIIPEAFGQTEMGRDLLAQDYILKQLTASLMYPENDLGKTFWDRVYKKAQELYGTTEIPINTFNKVWIVPDKAEVYETEDTAFVTESHLKVMLEGDYLALQNNLNQEEIGTDQLAQQDVEQLNDVSSQIVKEIILPAIEVEINEGKNFAQLRQIYNSLILAAWFKRALKDSILNKVYTDQNKIAGIDIEDKEAKQKIYNQYLEAFKKGVYDYIKEDYDPTTQEIIERRYFSGGVQLGFGTTNLGTGGALHVRSAADSDQAALGKVQKIILAIIVGTVLSAQVVLANPEDMPSLSKIAANPSRPVAEEPVALLPSSSSKSHPNARRKIKADPAALADAPRIPFEEQLNISLQALKTSMEAEWNKPANDVFDDLDKELLGKVIPLSQSSKRYREALDTRERKYTESLEKRSALEEAKSNLSEERKKRWVVKKFSTESRKKQRELPVQIAQLEAAIVTLPEEIRALDKSYAKEQEQIAEFRRAMTDIFSRYDSLKERLTLEGMPSWLVDFVINYKKMALRRKLIVGFLKNPLNDAYFNSSVAYALINTRSDELRYFGGFPTFLTAKGVTAELLEHLEHLVEARLKEMLGSVEYFEWEKIKANPLFQEIFQIPAEAVEESIGKRTLEIFKKYGLSHDLAHSEFSLAVHAALAVSKPEDYDELFDNFKKHLGVENSYAYVFIPFLAHLDVQRTIRELIELKQTQPSLPGLGGLIRTLEGHLERNKVSYQQQLTASEFIKMLALKLRANADVFNGAALFILNVFAQIDSPEAMDALIEEFNKSSDTENDYLINKIADVMANKNPQRAFPLILRRFIASSDKGLINSLAQSASDENLPELIDLLDGPSFAAYPTVVPYVIAKMKTPAAVNALLAKLRQNKNRKVSGNIEEALEANTFPEALPIYVQAFKEASRGEQDYYSDSEDYLTNLAVILAGYGAAAKEILPDLLNALLVISKSEGGRQAALNIITQCAAREDIPQLIARLSTVSTELTLGGGGALLVITKDKEIIIEAL